MIRYNIGKSEIQKHSEIEILEKDLSTIRLETGNPSQAGATAHFHHRFILQFLFPFRFLEDIGEEFFAFPNLEAAFIMIAEDVELILSSFVQFLDA